MADKTAARVHEDIEIEGGAYRYVVDSANDGSAAYITIEELYYHEDDDMHKWRWDGAFRFTPAELDALIDALTRARALREGE